MELVRDSAEDNYEQIFFNRPVGPLQRKNIGILVGKHTTLHEIESIYSVVLAFNHYPVLVADEDFKLQGVPAEVFLHRKKNAMHYENTDEAIGRLQDCHIILAGIGLELSAVMQLFLEKVWQSCNTATILTESVLTFPTLKNYLGSNTLLYANTKSLLRLGSNTAPSDAQGLSRKLELLADITNKLQTRLVCVEDYQILALEGGNATAAVINSTDKILVGTFLAAMAGLLADRIEPFGEGWYEYILAAGYLYKKIYIGSSNPSKMLKSLFS